MNKYYKHPSCLAGCYPSWSRALSGHAAWSSEAPRCCRKARSTVTPPLEGLSLPVVCPQLCLLSRWREPQDLELQNWPKTLLFEQAQGQKLPFRARVSHSCQPFPSKEQISWAISTRDASQPAPLAKLLNNTDLGINTMLTPGRTRRSLGEFSNSQGEVVGRKMLSCFLFACFQCRIKPSLSKLHSEQLLGTWALLNAAVREVGQVSRNCSKSQR